MKRNTFNPDIHVLISLLAETAASRAEIIKETWNYPQKYHPCAPSAWQQTIHDLVATQRSHIYERMYKVLTSEVMKMKYPRIAEIAKMDLSYIKKSTMILILIGLPADVIAEMILLSPGYVYTILKEYPAILK